jgi:predicted DNA-binding transcriptional regulator YafY
MPADGLDVALARAWARKGRKIGIVYRDRNNKVSDRIVWPVTVAYFDAARIVVAWCELREAFRDFRADRIVSAEFLDDRFPCRPSDLCRKWLASLTIVPTTEP